MSLPAPNGHAKTGALCGQGFVRQQTLLGRRFQTSQECEKQFVGIVRTVRRPIWKNAAESNYAGRNRQKKSSAAPSVPPNAQTVGRRTARMSIQISRGWSPAHNRDRSCPSHKAFSTRRATARIANASSEPHTGTRCAFSRRPRRSPNRDRLPPSERLRAKLNRRSEIALSRGRSWINFHWRRARRAHSPRQNQTRSSIVHGQYPL